MDTDRVKKVATQVLDMLSAEEADIGIMALVDVQVSILQLVEPGVTTVEACNKLIELLSRVRRAEAQHIPFGAEPHLMPLCMRCLYPCSNCETEPSDIEPN